MSSSFTSICVIGGTGSEGGGLALRWANHGHRVTIGSRDKSKAIAAAAELNKQLGADLIAGTESSEGVASSEVAVLTVPFQAQLATLRGLKPQLGGKILVDVTVPLVPPKVSRVQLPETDSCVVAAQKMLGEQVRVVSAFQNVSAHKLKNLDYDIDCDVLIAGDDKDARNVVIALAVDAGLRGIDVGPLANSVVAESLTSALIWINKHYKVADSGIRITGIAK